MSYDPYDGEYYERELDLLEPDQYDQDFYDYSDYGLNDEADCSCDGRYDITSKADLAKLPPHIEETFMALFEDENPFRDGRCYEVFVDFGEMTVEEYLLVNVVE